jgi:nitrile hydratase beta subunit
MDSVHDMGGMDGFGEVKPDPNEPIFHAEWEARVYAMNRSLGYAGAWVIDASRHAQERLPPHVYLRVSYFERWALAIEKNLVERGLAGADELAAGHALRPGKALPRKMTADIVEQALTRKPFSRPLDRPARFKTGDRVRARNMHPQGHTRLPRYVRGHVGVIERVHGTHVFPDSVAHGKGDDPQWLYTVRFEGRDLWGADSDPTLKVSVEAFEPYLEPSLEPSLKLLS